MIKNESLIEQSFLNDYLDSIPDPDIYACPRCDREDYFDNEDTFCMSNNEEQYCKTCCRCAECLLEKELHNERMALFDNTDSFFKTFDIF